MTKEALTFQRAVDISVSMESVARESQHLKTSLKGHVVSSLHHKAETNAFVVARQIIMK